MKYDPKYFKRLFHTVARKIMLALLTEHTNQIGNITFVKNIKLRMLSFSN